MLERKVIKLMWSTGCFCLVSDAWGVSACVRILLVLRLQVHQWL